MRDRETKRQRQRQREIKGERERERQRQKKRGRQRLKHMWANSSKIKRQVIKILIRLNETNKPTPQSNQPGHINRKNNGHVIETKIKKMIKKVVINR